jgi:Helix-turn-helix domain
MTSTSLTSKPQHGGRFAIIPARAIDDPRLGKAALLVLCTLATYSDRDGWSWPSLTTLANRLSVSRRHVTACIRELEELGYVETRPRFDKAGKQQTSVYRILHDVDLPADLFEVGVKSEFTPRDERGVQGGDEPGVHPERTILTTHMNNTDSGPSFEVFWRVYPKRTPHSNPKQPAKKKFDSAVKRGVPAGTIVRGAQNYALYVEREGVNPKYVAQAQTWLNQERWEDHQEAPANSEREVAPL